MPRFLHRGSRRIDSPRENELAARLEEDRQHNPLTGRPLTAHASPFALEVKDYLRAAAGAPAWSQRLARIHQLQTELHEGLRSAYAEHRRRFGARPRDFAQRWRTHLAALDLAPLNLLIEKHNAYYPIEANLRTHWPSGRYLLPRGIEYPQARVTLAALLERYPSESADASEDR